MTDLTEEALEQLVYEIHQEREERRKKIGNACSIVIQPRIINFLRKRYRCHNWMTDEQVLQKAFRKMGY